MGNLSCGNLDPPPSSGGQSAASSPSALHEDGLTKRFRRCRSPFREPPKSDRHPVGMVIAIISESRSALVRNRDRHHLGTLIAIARNTQLVSKRVVKLKQIHGTLRRHPRLYRLGREC